MHRILSPPLGAPLVLLTFWGVLSCTAVERSASQGDEASETGKFPSGSTLVQQHCTRCHPAPEPEHLPRRTWPLVLDWMGNYLGYKNTEGSLDVLVNQEQVPESPIVSPEKLDTIREYFLSNAPEGPLRPTNAPSDIETSALFDPVERDILPDEVAYGRREVVTLVEVAEDPPRLFVGEGNENMLLEYREPDTDDAKSALELIRAVQFDTQPVEIETAGDTLTVTLIGDLIKGRKKGQVVRLSPGEGQLKATHLVQDHYRTPHACLHDLNASGRKDLVVAGFGDFGEGRLSWFENLGDDRYKEHVLWEQNGAIKTAVHDFNGDGRPDIMALFAQARQELVVYLNRGEGKFEKVQVFRKYPSFGVNGFELVDFDGDGLKDVLLLNGNNMEISDPPLRDNHGVRVLRNQGDLEFKEAYFYPMYGAIDATAADFTGDGLLDVAAVSFFPDWEAEPPETFVILKQTRPLDFAPSTVPAAQGNRWMRVDAGDLYGDGTVDLVLGAAGITHGVPENSRDSFIKRFNESPPVLILRNK